MRIGKKSSGEPYILTPEKFDFSSLTEFKRKYTEVLSQVSNELDIDFSCTHYIDSSALGMLIVCRSYYLEHEKTVRLCNASDDVKQVLLISRFDKKFSII